VLFKNAEPRAVNAAGLSPQNPIGAKGKRQIAFIKLTAANFLDKITKTNGDGARQKRLFG
jgi:hypothetical protein